MLLSFLYYKNTKKLRKEELIHATNINNNNNNNNTTNNTTNNTNTNANTKTNTNTNKNEDDDNTNNDKAGLSSSNFPLLTQDW